MILYLYSVSGGKHSDGAEGDFNVAAELEKLQQFQYSQCHLDIGELLRVRGPVKTSRQQREIMASTYCECSEIFISFKMQQIYLISSILTFKTQRKQISKNTIVQLHSHIIQILLLI